ncbi:MAG: hypothetical protein QOG43_1095 [Actinomycetota bacterium]|jgi:hypothetical protein|nr:hypothetical protein [Actinomycetota bacterium]
MDLPPPVQDPERREDAGDPGRRLAAVEAELIALGARLEQLEASLQQAVREETRRASNEIRHTVSELGRRLALDLPQFLDRHRLLIVNELRGGGAAAATAPTSTPAPTDAPTGTPDAPVAETDVDDDDTSADDAGGGRRKRRRRKDG